MGAEGTISCAFDWKKSKNALRISALVIIFTAGVTVDYCGLTGYICRALLGCKGNDSAFIFILQTVKAGS
jgi:hypothetical protein